MPQQKYKIYYNLMIKNNQPLLDAFKLIHDNYQANPNKYRTAFNKTGRDVLDVMRSFERKLCSGMERTNNAAYSDRVAEKYWSEIRKTFPLIDQVGVTIRQVKVN
ncbi:hypothetical protein FWH30_01090 [Microgenomates group bacterium]|nr:hypothetical protein [Microgenomates group bacterium]